MIKMTTNDDSDDDYVTVDRDFLAKVGTELTLAYLILCPSASYSYQLAKTLLFRIGRGGRGYHIF